MAIWGLWCGKRASSSAGQAHPLREPRGTTSSRSLERKVADHHRFVLRSNFSGSTKKRLSPQRASARKYQYRLREFPTPRKYLKIGAPEESRVATRRRRRMARASRRCCGFPSRLPKAALDAECTKHTSASSHKVRWDICAAAMLPRAHGPVLATYPSGILASRYKDQYSHYRQERVRIGAPSFLMHCAHCTS